MPPIPHLYLLQYTCLLSALFMVLTLCVARLQQNHTTPTYERARWTQVVAMALLIIHYFLQMHFQIRANSVEWGQMVNMLFYGPAAFLMSCSIMLMDGPRKHIKRYVLTGGAVCLIVPIVFGTGWLLRRGGDMPMVQTLMHLLFVVQMLYYIIAPLLVIRRNVRRVVNETGGEIFVYVKYAQSSYVILCATTFMMLFAIMWPPLLYVIGPLMLVAMFLYVLSFVALGFNLAPLEDVLEENESENPEVAEAPAPLTPNAGPEPSAPAPPAKPRSATGRESHLSEERAEEIRQLVEQWLQNGGFRETTTNMVTLSRNIRVSRNDISAYFECHLHTTFRVWLSDIRLKEAQKLMKEHPEYGNDTISTSCGFSSRSQLYRIFSDKLGMTPGEWRERQQGQ